MAIWGGGTKTYKFKSAAEFRTATAHGRYTNRPDGEYRVGDEMVAAKRMVNVQIGSAITVLGTGFMGDCINYNSPLYIPDSVTAVETNLLNYCSNFNSPVYFPETCNFSGEEAFNYCKKFNSPVKLPINYTGTQKFGYRYLMDCSAYNQPVVLPANVDKINHYFLNDCRAFNSAIVVSQPIIFIGQSFLYGCSVFNQPLDFLKDLVTLVAGSNGFLEGCKAFNQPLNFASLETLSGRVLRGCTAFNSPILFPKLKTFSSGSLLYNCISFNQPLDFPELVSMGTLGVLGHYNHVLILYAEGGDRRLSFNSPMSFPKLESLKGEILTQPQQYTHSLSFPKLRQVEKYGATGAYSSSILTRCLGLSGTFSFPMLSLDTTGSLNLLNMYYDSASKLASNPPTDFTVVLNSNITDLGAMLGSGSLAITCSKYGNPMPNVSGLTTKMYIKGTTQSAIDTLPNIATTTRYRNLVKA